jgi:hypothetical protein
VMPLVQPPVLAGVRDLIGLFSMDIDEETPDTAPGSDGGASGHAMTLTKSFALAAASDTMSGVAECIRWIGEGVAEACDSLREKFDVRVPVYVQEELPVDDEGESRERMVALELHERWLKGNHRLKDEFERVANIAEIEQTASLAERKFATFEDVMKARGKRSPDTERVKIDADAVRNSPEGQLLALASVYRRRGDQQRAETLELQVKNALTEAGVPVEALDPAVRPGAQPALGAPQGMASPIAPGGVGQGDPGGGSMAVPDMAPQILAGIQSGAMGTASRMNDAEALMVAGTPQV